MKSTYSYIFIFGIVISHFILTTPINVESFNSGKVLISMDKGKKINWIKNC